MADGEQETRTCARRRCGTEFTPASPQHRFCSPNCRKRAHEERERRREARFVAQRLVTPERVAEALVAYDEMKREGEL